jgi:hypothetical protein
MTTTERKQTDYYELVGRIDEDYYFCDYIFEDGDFKGATATVVRPVFSGEYNDEDRLREWADELWRGAVANEDTDLGLDEWIDYADITSESMFDTDIKGVIYDKMRELYPDEDETPVFECIGGGRSFSKDMKFDEVFNDSLLKKINKVEV